MNPREFCRIANLDVAICLTYSFDPIFFERVIIHDLFAGGATDILVVSDMHATEEALERAMGQVTLLGRRYQLAHIINESNTSRKSRSTRQSKSGRSGRSARIKQSDCGRLECES